MNINKLAQDEELEELSKDRNSLVQYKDVRKNKQGYLEMIKKADNEAFIEVIRKYYESGDIEGWERCAIDRFVKWYGEQE